jgi:aspartyl-tRNA(Asn)/glutamyl-tRNA(Gln) amidotransferase subunit A
MSASPADAGLFDAGLRVVSERIASGELTAAAVIDSTLARIAALNPELRAFSYVDVEGARRAAEERDRELEKGERRGPLHGLPVAVKDLIAVEGLPLEAGSQVLKGNVADRDAEVVAKLKADGAVIVGKTTMAEFALTAESGGARNYRFPDHTSGGSSGGSAVAVVAGMCAAALGSDTGGSLRIPAACCGVAALKPTFAPIPDGDAIPFSSSCDHLGQLARTVEDLAFFLGAGERSVDLGGLVVGVPDSAALGGLDPDVGAVFQSGLERFRDRGATVRKVHLPAVDEVLPEHFALAVPEGVAYHVKQFGLSMDDYGPVARSALEEGRDVLAWRHLLAREARDRFRSEVDAALAEADVLALPVMAIATPAAGATEVELPDGRVVSPTAAMVRLTCLFNDTGHPALALPVPGAPGRALQLVAAHGADDSLLATGVAIESALKEAAA